ncbi:sodium/proton antiporter 2 isoform X2 [Macadamia integrifolia]|uniref:sodium/proton antiporter 2 isoform X2 n=1 Tax=Macadamia integrifolia TaxID=60698 RepID=UPI001C4FCF3D|nr:sodium/proton antiporter 2 isoform X2 [Macadamia integrifolia]
MATFSIASHHYTSNRFIPGNRSYPTSSLRSFPFQRNSTRPSLPRLGSSPWRADGRTWRGQGLLARAEEKAKDGSSSSVGQQAIEKADEQYQELMSKSGTCDPLCSVDEMSSQDFEATYQPKTDLFKAVAILASAAVGAVAINHSWVAANQDVAMALVFGLGYAGIIFEESLAFNKSGVGLLMAVSLWVIRSIGAPSTDIAVKELSNASAEVSEIVFFLLGAMTIVEIVDAHQGFKLVTDNITTRKPKTLLWVVGFVTFFLSSILDNLTSTIVMVSLLRKLVPPSEFRKFLGAVVVIAANAGGAWTPIGDVTTTMLWIHGQISTLQTMKDLFIPSITSLVVPLALMSLTSEVNGKGQNSPNVLASEQMAPRGKLVFSVGIGALVFVPVFKAITGLPPYMGMLLGLGFLWILTDAIHYGESERQKLRVPQALSRIDTQGALFFLGILLSVGSLEASGLLRELANYLDAHIPNIELIASAIGVVSAIIDNVPLVAATMGMYDLSSFPQDSELWQLVAYCAGTGGSMLVIGSAAGVAFMGMEKADFFWYLRKVSGFAFAGYTAGIVAYLATHNLRLSLPTELAQVPFLSGS